MQLKLILVLGLSAAAPVALAADDGSARLVQARLAADQGLLEAERLFQAIVEDDGLPAASRCEARVRRAAVVRQAGDFARSLDLFEEAAAQCGSEREPMRLLVEALSGIEQAPERWADVPLPLHLVIRRQGGGRFTFGYSFGEVPAPEPWEGAEPFTGEPISISMKDAFLGDVFHLFEQFTGTEFTVTEEASKRTITLELTDVPWDQAMALILRTNGLRAERWGDGWSIVPSPGR